MHTQCSSPGETELLHHFSDGNIIVLESRMSGKTLFFDEGRIKATGDHGSGGKYELIFTP